MKTGFFRTNARAFGAAAVTTATVTWLEQYANNKIAEGTQVAMSNVTNPNTDPDVALHSVRFLRDRNNASIGLFSGLRAGLTGEWRKRAQAQDARNQELDKLEQYWKGRQLDRRLPVSGSAAPVPTNRK